MTRAGTAPSSGPDWLRFVPAGVRGLVESHLPEFLRGSDAEPAPPPPAEETIDAPPHAGRFLAETFSNHAGSRPYKVYVPGSYRGQRVPLVVMLHGCTQSPDDFALGTGMNAAADTQCFIVAYPGQTRAAHAQKCWQWFSAEDQVRDAGEPSLIAGITRQVMRDYAIDPDRVTIAGFSAGGAMAAVMGEAYPDLYAAVAVHSGLACGAASNLSAALAAMKRGGGAQTRTGRTSLPTIVFHGEADATVNACNAEEIVARALQADVAREETRVGRTPGGRRYSQTVHYDRTGRSVVEQWVVHGAGHAWSGGTAPGSFTDPSGPDATSEMLRFFRDHRRAGPKN